MSKKYYPHSRPVVGSYSAKLGVKEHNPSPNPPSYGQLRTAVNHLMGENDRLRRRIENLAADAGEMRQDIDRLMQMCSSLGKIARESTVENIESVSRLQDALENWQSAEDRLNSIV